LKSKPTLKLVILEIGCGLRVPSLRKKGEELSRDLGAQASLVRINPEYPSNPLVHPPTVGVKSKGLAALRRIDALWTESA